jgi:hypothetical protein
MGAIVVAYYVRARRRVASIKAAIQRYQEATKVVGGAVEQAYAGRS